MLTSLVIGNLSTTCEYYLEIMDTLVMSGLGEKLKNSDFILEIKMAELN